MQKLVNGISNISSTGNHVGLAHYASPDMTSGVTLMLNQGTSTAVGFVFGAHYSVNL